MIFYIYIFIYFNFIYLLCRFGRGKYNDSQEFIQTATYPENLEYLRYVFLFLFHFFCFSFLFFSLSLVVFYFYCFFLFWFFFIFFSSPLFMFSRLVAFDSPSISFGAFPFENRYELLLAAIPSTHPILISIEERRRRRKKNWW